MAAKQKTYSLCRLVNGEVATVEVMAVASHYAMVRRPRCLPFVVSTNELRDPVRCDLCGNSSFDCGLMPTIGSGHICEKCDGQIERQPTRKMCKEVTEGMKALDKLQEANRG